MIALASRLTQRDLPWAAWKALRATKSGVHQYDDDGSMYTIWFYDGDEVYICKMWKGAVPDGIQLSYSQSQNDSDKADFEAGLKLTANAALVAKSNNRVIVSPTFEDSVGLAPIWRGNHNVAVAGATSIFDVLITSERRLRGGWYELLMRDEAMIGDYIEFSVVDKDDLFGYFSYYGLTVGTDVLELKKYVFNEYICPSRVGNRNEFITGGVFLVMPGIYFRTTYHSFGSTDVNFKTVTYAYE
jgi:hypothetical protein